MTAEEMASRIYTLCISKVLLNSNWKVDEKICDQVAVSAWEAADIFCEGKKRVRPWAYPNEAANEGKKPYAGT